MDIEPKQRVTTNIPHSLWLSVREDVTDRKNDISWQGLLIRGIEDYLWEQGNGRSRQDAITALVNKIKELSINGSD